MWWWIGGAILVLIVAIYSVQALQRMAFDRAVQEEIDAFFQGVQPRDEDIVTEGDVEALPAPVARWLTAAGVVGAPKIRTLRIEQSIRMKLKPDGAWLQARATQYDRVEDPAFLWKAHIELPLGLHISGRDLFDKGKGHMLIKPLSLFKAVDSRGLEIDEGSMQRFLGEIVWMPTAALEPSITWEAEGEHAAKATMHHKGVTVSGRFTFDPETGLVSSFRTLRFIEIDGAYELRPWEIPVSDYQTFGPYLLPARGTVIWQMPGGPYDWFHFVIEEVAINDI